MSFTVFCFMLIMLFFHLPLKIKKNSNSSHAEVLVYDWTQPGNSEIVVEDIERIDFDKYGVYDNKMKDWRRINKWDWNNSRQKQVQKYFFSAEERVFLFKIKDLS